MGENEMRLQRVLRCFHLPFFPRCVNYRNHGKHKNPCTALAIHTSHICPYTFLHVTSICDTRFGCIYPCSVLAHVCLRVQVPASSGVFVVPPPPTANNIRDFEVREDDNVEGEDADQYTETR